MKKFHALFIFALSLCLLTGPVLAAKQKVEVYTPIQTTPEDLELVAVGTVKEVPKSNQIMLNNGKIYALDNVRVPVHYEQEVKDYLTQKLAGKQVGVFVNKFLKKNHNDELGNLLGHIVTEDAGWVQADLVAKGYAWAFSSPTSRDMVIPLYAYEVAARKNKMGLWRNSAENGVKYDATIEGTAGSFQIYEGVARGLRAGTGYNYINFGPDPTTDFTILIKSSDMGFFNRAFIDAIPRQHIRVRGWVEDNSGPAIIVNHPEQIEMLGRDPIVIKLQPCEEGKKSNARKPCQEKGQPDTMTIQD